MAKIRQFKDGSVLVKLENRRIYVFQKEGMFNITFVRLLALEGNVDKIKPHFDYVSPIKFNRVVVLKYVTISNEAANALAVAIACVLGITPTNLSEKVDLSLAIKVK